MQNVTIKKGKRIVLEHANFSIYEGEFVYLINPIKSGRHVFTDFFGGRSAFEGQIYFEDVKISSFDRVCQEKKVYLLRQDTMLFTELSVAENLLLEKKKRPSFFVNKTIFRLKAEILLNELSAGKLSDKQAWELSRFEQHKVLLCGAIALKPSLIIIDSSFPEYTKVEQMEFVKILRTIQEKGIAILNVLENILVKRNGSSFSITSKIDKVLAKDIEMFLGLSKEKLMEPMCAQNMYMRLKAVLFRYYLLSPDVIVLEQPYNYLDYTGRTILNEFLEQYSKKGISVIFWTANHMDLSETVATCYTFQDDVLIPMNAGTT